MSRRVIIRLFQLTHVALVGSVLVGAGLVVGGYQPLSWAREMGSLWARGSLLLLAITLLPGITRRLRLALVVNRWLMPYRRHLGILTYLSAAGHGVANYYLPNYQRWGTPLPQTLPPWFISMGLLALILMTPLFITSNDAAVRRLGKWWGRVHMLVYGVILVVLLHLALQRSGWSWLAGGVLLFEVLSFLSEGVRRLKQKGSLQEHASANTSF